MSFSWQDIWRLVKRWWWLAVIAVILAGGTSYYFASKKPNIYAARTRLMVGSGIRSPDPNSQDFNLSITLAEAYAEMARQRPVTQGVVDRLGLPIGWWDLAGSIQTRVIPNAQLLEITVLDTNPEFAAAMANAVADELIRQSPASSGDAIDRDFVRQELAGAQAKLQETQSQIDELRDGMVNLTSAAELEDARTRLEELEQLRLIYNSNYVELASLLNTQSPNTLTVVEPAGPSMHPVAPNPKKEAVMAAVAGLALAIGAVLLLEFADDTLRIQDTGTEQVMGLPVLGTVVRMAGGRCEPRSPAAEMLRQLRTKVLLSSLPANGMQADSGRLQSLLVTGAMANDGKTVITANLGVTMAAGGARVVLVDADLRAPALHEWLDLPNVAGLTDLLNTDKAQCEQLLPQLLRDTSVPGLSFLPAGRPPLDPSILLTSPRMPDLLTLLSHRFDFVLFDSPPVPTAPDATILAMLADATLLVISPGRSGRRAIKRAKDELLARKDVHLIGVALNRTSLSHYAYKYAAHWEPEAPERFVARVRHTLKPGKLIASLPVIGKPPEPGLLSLAEAATALGVRRKTVKRWLKEGRLPAVKKHLRWWVKQDALSMLLDGLATESASDSQVRSGSNGRSAFEGLSQPVDIHSNDETPDTEPVKESLEGSSD